MKIRKVKKHVRTYVYDYEIVSIRYFKGVFFKLSKSTGVY